jgi:mannose-6-phosphate isomerase
MSPSGTPRFGGPLVLGPNQPRRFYAGGSAIAALRGLPAAEDHVPEDWVASTTESVGSGGVGLTVLQDGRTLRDAIVADPVHFLGAEHVAAFGDDPALLVKLLDAGERLPVHCHPDREFARRHLGSVHGKTEAWVVLGSTDHALVHVGFRHDVPEDVLAGWVSRQDREALLGALNVLPVGPGDTVVIPAGTPHSIGAGVFVIELQEPTDFSAMLEREGFPLGDEGDLGLGVLALGCVDRTAWSAARLAALRGHDVRNPDRPVNVLAPAAEGFFRADRVPAGCELDAGYAVLIVLDGSGELRTERGGSIEIAAGATVLVPHAAGRYSLGGDLQAMRCRPPSPAAVLR